MRFSILLLLFIICLNSSAQNAKGNMLEHFPHKTLRTEIIRFL
jgi:hypothetical protein